MRASEEWVHSLKTITRKTFSELRWIWNLYGRCRVSQCQGVVPWFYDHAFLFRDPILFMSRTLEYDDDLNNSEHQHFVAQHKNYIDKCVYRNADGSAWLGLNVCVCMCMFTGLCCSRFSMFKNHIIIFKVSVFLFKHECVLVFGWKSTAHVSSAVCSARIETYSYTPTPIMIIHRKRFSWIQRIKCTDSKNYQWNNQPCNLFIAYAFECVFVFVGLCMYEIYFFL